MADRQSARPVSGEIMTALKDPPAAAAYVPPAAAGDVVDADYEVLPRFGRRDNPRNGPDGLSASADNVAAAQGMDMLRKPDAASAPSTPGRRGGPIFWTAGACAVFAAFWISGGHVLLRGAAASLAQDPPAVLNLTSITSRVDTSGANPVLFVDGEAGNDGAEASALPPLEIHVTGKDGTITRYRLGTSGRLLASGERFAFSSRLEVPKNGVKNVSVAFAR
ncbi:hypothetical protein [Mesorhizobium sp. BE184]|uniref:hypothetical protein n=1 Tax=Mesorhizobium sp. BE184 TaxID=2817714 RepID=UPI00285E93F8|nr:hypothetical protein [Mesorhizobium sp. BE184]MDR7034217.1 hypothetical protein [Mesorhizobium sp. BE184]